MQIKGKNLSAGLRIFAALLICMLVLYGAIHTIQVMDEDYTEQLWQSLRDVGKQNALALETHMNEKRQLLSGMAESVLHADEAPETVLLRLKTFVDAYGLKRLGYCTPDGMTHSTDGVTVDLSRRDFFRESMLGHWSISEVLTDAMTTSGENEYVTVISAPIYQDADDTVDGVFCLTYDADAFSNDMKTTCFDGQGFSCAVNMDGQMMIADAGNKLPLSQNLLTELLPADERNDAAVVKLNQAMQKGIACSGTIYFPYAHYFYAVPVRMIGDDVTWYSLTMVSEKYVQSRRTGMVGHLRNVLLIVMSMMVLALLLIVTIYAVQQKRIKQLAYGDPLTGGENYAAFCHKLRTKGVRSGWLISMDVAGFKNVYLALGRKHGDEILASIWNVIHAEQKKNEIACHNREDHFVLYAAECDRQTLVNRIRQLTAQIERVFEQHNVPTLHPNFGIADIVSAETLEDAHTKAKIAREFVRSQKTPCYAFFSERDYEHMVEEQHIQENVTSMLQDHSFEAWYQPKYSSDSQHLVGAEALVRWRNERNEPVTPSRFISLLEKNGTIAQLDEYMFRTVCSQLHEWRARGLPQLPVSVNLSRASVYSNNVVQRYTDIVREYGLSPEMLEIEITETAVAGNDFVSKVMTGFKQKGFHVLMDDFGSGYSSLSQLNKTCFDTIKLDKCLVDRIGESDGELLLASVIQLGHRMGMSIVAEGVERHDQATFLRQAECDDIQGYYFGRPMTAMDFEKLLSRDGKR